MLWLCDVKFLPFCICLTYEAAFCLYYWHPVRHIWKDEVYMQARPSFSELLASSLKVDARMRAWYDASLGYQQVQQTRLPKALPEVMPALPASSYDQCFAMN